MPCPRCGRKDIMGSKITLLGQQPEVAPGVRTGDIVAYSFYCPKCSLLEESSTETPDELRRLDQRWESVPQLEQAVVWNETNDPFDLAWLPWTGRREPPRDLRRLVVVSHAAIA